MLFTQKRACVKSKSFIAMIRIALFLLFLIIIESNEEPPYKLPIIFVHTITKSICQHGIPSYIFHSLHQALLTQGDGSEIILASNFGDCNFTLYGHDKLSTKIKLIDMASIASERTLTFGQIAKEIFQTDGWGELWLTSALRFFYLEDIMKHYSYHEMMHVESDNMLYGPLVELLPYLRVEYPGLAATPLTSESFITASVFWIASIKSLADFNEYLFDLANNTVVIENKNNDNQNNSNINNNNINNNNTQQLNRWDTYLKWLRPYACCKKGGTAQDAQGNGIKPFAINEMSMLAHYHYLHPNIFKILPVVPEYTYILNRYVVNMSEWSPNAPRVGPRTGAGIWDPNSWGQHIGGTHQKQGKNKGFSDPSHIAGQAMRTTYCKTLFQCSNISLSLLYLPQSFHHDVKFKTASASAISNNTSTILSYKNNSNNNTINNNDGNNNGRDSTNIISRSKDTNCYLIPFAQCGNEDMGIVTVPLWNLHVHSKHTADYLSTICPCHYN